MTSGGTKAGPTADGKLVKNPALVEAASARIQALRDADPGNTAKVPVDLVTASGSGLDPDISPAAAHYQAPRIARLRGIPLERVTALIDGVTVERTLGVLGERRVNVVRLNQELDKLAEKR
jgi:K+-transporting ATPase ATPase C chain